MFISQFHPLVQCMWRNMWLVSNCSTNGQVTGTVWEIAQIRQKLVLLISVRVGTRCVGNECLEQLIFLRGDTFIDFNFGARNPLVSLLKAGSGLPV